MIKFQVGDKVRAISDNYIFSTKSNNWEGEVIEVKDESFRAKTTHWFGKDDIGYVFDRLDYKDFELIKSVIKDPVLRVDELI